jgi:hypothetical protein
MPHGTMGIWACQIIFTKFVNISQNRDSFKKNLLCNIFFNLEVLTGATRCRTAPYTAFSYLGRVLAGMDAGCNKAQGIEAEILLAKPKD